VVTLALYSKKDNKMWLNSHCIRKKIIKRGYTSSVFDKYAYISTVFDISFQNSVTLAANSIKVITHRYISIQLDYVRIAFKVTMLH
jgi:hypothetical protein